MIYVSSLFLRNEAVFHKRFIPRSNLDGVAKGRRPDTRASLFFNRGRLLPCSVCLSCLHRCFAGFLLQFAASPINKYFPAEALNKIPDLTRPASTQSKDILAYHRLCLHSPRKTVHIHLAVRISLPLLP